MLVLNTGTPLALAEVLCPLLAPVCCVHWLYKIIQRHQINYQHFFQNLTSIAHKLGYREFYLHLFIVSDTDEESADRDFSKSLLSSTKNWKMDKLLHLRIAKSINDWKFFFYKKKKLPRHSLAKPFRDRSICLPPNWRQQIQSSFIRLG